MAATARVIDNVHHTCVQGWNNLPGTRRVQYTELMVEFDLRDPGRAHVCGITYTTDLWNTRETAYAECLRLDGPYAPSGVERWAVHVDVPAHVPNFEYVVFCFDHASGDSVKEIFNTNGGKLFHAIPGAGREVPEVSVRRFARASAPTTRDTLRGQGAAVRLMPAARTQPDVAGAPTERVTAHPVDVSHPLVTRYMEILMMRNFATNTWQFKANRRLSSPGCVIASPAEPGDPGTDQSYANCWVRDSALCVAQAASTDLPWDSTDLLDDYITFSRTTQRNAQHQNRPGHACFFVDGALRPWSVQNDGPALRVITVLGFFDRLSDSAKTEAQALVADDVAHLLAVCQSPTTNLWEETNGFHFFTRAVQKRCFELVSGLRETLGLNLDAGALTDATGRLTRQLEEHWHTDSNRGRGYYRATVGGHGRGDDVDSSTLMGAVYGQLRAAQPRLLATASVIWDSFRTLYNINHDDHAHGIGPMIGRYPEDEYDGDIAEMPNVGHPWPLCTAVFAEYYYRVALQLKQDRELTIDDLTSRFFEQIDVTPGPGSYRVDSPQFDLALCKLRAAGDRMLDAVVAHSDHLELSEQVDRHTGFQKSVRNLTWSYAAYLSAARIRKTL